MPYPRSAHIMAACGLLASAAWISSCGSKSGQAEASTARTPEELVVPVQKVVRTNLSTDLVLTGEFIPYQEIDVMAKEAGYIKSIRVDIGDRVRAGELLAELEIPEMQDDIARADAGVQAAQADIEAAQGDLSRAESTYDIANLSYKRIADVAKKEPGLVPQQEVDVAHSKQLETAAQVAAAKSNLETTQRKLAMSKAEQARWATLQKYTIIGAPFTGVVTKRYANTGAMIQQGTASETQAMPVVRLSQNDLLRLIVPVPESAVPGIHIGQAVDVNVTALRKTFPGRVTRFEDKVSTATRTMNTEIDVPNPNYVLVPGMYAEVDLITEQHKGVLAIPVEALEGSGETARVYTIQFSGTVNIVPIRTGIESARQLEVLSGGLTEGEEVAVGLRSQLKDGDKVQAKTSDAAAGSPHS